MIKTTYETDINVKKFVKSLSCLAYIRRSEVLSTFNQLKNDENFPNCLEPLNSYFNWNYISTDISTDTTDISTDFYW